MSNLAIGLAGIGAMLLLLFLRVPVGAALGLVSLAGIAAIRGFGAAFGSLATLPYQFSASWTLSAVPMFLLLGAFAFHMGLTRGIYDAARAWLGWLPGGMAVASNWACTLFGAASGSSVATTSAIGKIAIPEMLRLGYHPALATGAVAAAGTIDALLAALEHHPGAIPAAPVADTLKRVVDGIITETVPRDGLFRAQTPQAFRIAPLLAAHRSGKIGATDDASLLEAAGETVAIVPGSDDNIKLTYPDDLVRLERAMSVATSIGLIPRVGTGFDVHVLTAGRKLFLCGVEVPHDQGLAGHSDADVGIHALCDAIYGALAEGDIGRHFPPSQAEWKDVDSARFLAHAASRIAARGGRLANADVTLICERPKIAPHAAAMMARLADIMGVAPGLISVKATTTERLGFTGRGEGIAAQAVATLLLPG